MTKVKYVFLFFMLFTSSIYAQQRFTISGTIEDKNSGETIIGAAVWVREIPGKGMISNEHGLYSITLPAGNYTLACSFLGFKEQTIPVELSHNIKIDISMESKSMEIDEIVVLAKPRDENITQTQVGVERLELKDVAKIPVLFGEKDALKTLQLLPGIKGGTEGSSGFFVRGGAADQNLILLDQAPVYNASHLMGFFSTFNSDAIKDVVVYKGNGPAQYGGRLSSVVDIKMNDGNNKKYAASGGIGLISSRLNLEGPIQKDKSSFILSARRSYADIFLKMTGDEADKKSKLYFFDLNAKTNFQLGEKDRLFISGYFGEDILNRSGAFSIDWGNATATVRWNHIINNKMFMNTSLIFSRFNYKAGVDFGETSFALRSSIQDCDFGQEFQYYPNSDHKIRFGLNTIYHTIKPGELEVSATSVMKGLELEDKLGWESAVYFSHEWDAAENFSLIYGLRVSLFSALGKGTFYSFDPDGTMTGKEEYASGKFVKTYFTPEPRISANFALSPSASIKAGYARNSQYLHLVSNATSGTPLDVWVPTTKNVQPEIADQLSLGFFKNLVDNKVEMSVEGYYKKLHNQIDYRDGADTQTNELIEGEFLYGSGRAYGIELYLKKKHGSLNGWISYTLSRTEKKIDGINKNNWYPARQDRTHDISVVATYDLNQKWNFGAVWVYYTGSAVTFPAGKYIVDNRVQYYYTERNAHRMPAYHRLDLSATWTVKKTKRFESSWNFSIYNVYGKENAFAIFFRQNENNPEITEAVQFSIFRWIPSFTYNFRF